MKVRSLQNYPQQLADERVIGAAGTAASEREYELPELAKEDKKRVKLGWLEVVEEKPAPPKEPETKTPAQTTGNSKGDNK